MACLPSFCRSLTQSLLHGGDRLAMSSRRVPGRAAEPASTPLAFQPSPCIQSNLRASILDRIPRSIRVAALRPAAKPFGMPTKHSYRRGSQLAPSPRASPYKTELWVWHVDVTPRVPQELSHMPKQHLVGVVKAPRDSPHHRRSSEHQ